ncbi:hypothetical protein JXI42_03040 [bacterium]|nr:hypothetical protein [bacterium]
MYSKKAFLGFIIITFLSLIILITCSKDDNPQGPSNNDGQFVYSQDLILPEDDSTLVSVEVSTGEVVFNFSQPPDTLDYIEGKILVGTEDGGYLRKVVGDPVYDGNTVTCATSNAALSEAITQGSFSYSATLEPIMGRQRGISVDTTIREEGQPPYHLRATSPPPRISQRKGVTDFDYTDIEITFTVAEYNAITIGIDTLRFSFESGLNLYTVINIAFIDTFIMYLEQSVEVRFIGVEFEFDQSIPLGSKEIELFSVDFAPLTFFAGVIPVLLFPSLDLSISAEAALHLSSVATLQNEARVSASYTAGAGWTEGWDVIYSKSLEGEGSLESAATRQITGELTEGISFEFGFMFYDITGPEIYINPYLYQEVSFPPLGVDIGAGVEGGVNYVVEFLSYELYSFNYPLVDYRYSFYSWEQSIPPPPELRFPEPGTTFVDPNFSFHWWEVYDADEYTIQVASDSYFIDIEYETDTDSNEVTCDESLEDGIYYWRVKVANNSGYYSDWSNCWVFAVGEDTPPDVPELEYPDDSTIVRSGMPIFSWSRSPGADRYQFQISKTERFTSTVMDTMVIVTYCEPSLLSTDFYYWRVRAFSPEGIYSQWSEVWTFSTFQVVVETEGRCEVSGQPLQIIIDDDIAYLLSAYYLDVIDISDPEYPAVINTYDIPGRASSMSLYEDYIYMTASDSGLIILDVNDPSVIARVGGDPDFSGYVIELDYPYAYILTNVGTKVVDVFDVEYPYLTGEIEDLDNGEKDLKLNGEYAFITYESGGFNAYDISNPESPAYVNSLLNYADEISLQGDLGFVSEHIGTEVFVVDISDPATWSGMWGGVMSHFESYYRITDLVSNDTYFFVGHNTTGSSEVDDGLEVIEIVNYSDPEEPSRSAFIAATGYHDGVRCLAVCGNYLYSGTVTSDLVIYHFE